MKTAFLKKEMSVVCFDFLKFSLQRQDLLSHRSERCLLRRSLNLQQNIIEES